MLLVKSFHVISIICWFAGLFYLPRLFVYHAMAETARQHNPAENTAIEYFKIMERKLYYGITTPSMIASTISGLWLLHSYGWAAYSQMGWLHAKLTLALLLIIYHFSMGYFYKQFLANKNKKSHVFYRFYNEVPVVFLIGIIVLITLKPF